MKKLTMALLAAVAGSFVSSTASAQMDLTGWYAALGAGVHNPDSSRVNAEIPAGTAYLRNKTTFGTGFGIHGAVGYEWPMGFRSELEVGYRTSKLGRTTITGLSPTPFELSGSQKVVGLMGNLLFDVGVGSNFKPYIGGGVGFGWNKWDGVGGVTTPTLAPVFNDSDTALQWQAIVGVTVPFSDSVDGYVDYRYIGANKYRFEAAPANSLIRNHDDSSHNLFLGVRFHF